MTVLFALFVVGIAIFFIAQFTEPITDASSKQKDNHFFAAVIGGTIAAVALFIMAIIV